MINSRSKGKRGELELAKYLKLRGFTGARRGQQFKGTPDSPDIVDAISGFHIECKRVEALQLYPAMAQAKKDAAAHDAPVVIHRRNQEEWVAILPLDVFLELVKDRA